MPDIKISDFFGLFYLALKLDYALTAGLVLPLDCFVSVLELFYCVFVLTGIAHGHAVEGSGTLWEPDAPAIVLFICFIIGAL